MNNLPEFINKLGHPKTYDIVIIVVGILNLFVFVYLWSLIKKLSDDMEPKYSLLIQNAFDENNLQSDSEHIKSKLYSDWKSLNDKINFIYNFFISIISVLPYLGILGTVMSLLDIKDFSPTQVQTSFGTALTATFWGLVFASSEKILEGLVSHKISDKNYQIELILDRYYKLNHDIIEFDGKNSLNKNSKIIANKSEKTSESELKH